MGAVKLRVRERGVNLQGLLSQFADTYLKCQDSWDEELNQDPDLDEDPFIKYDHYETWMQNSGFDYINRGCYASVFSSKCGNYVFKVLGYGSGHKEHDGCLDWIHFCMRNQGRNPLIPRVLGLRMFKDLTIIMLDRYALTGEEVNDGWVNFPIDDEVIYRRIRGIKAGLRHMQCRSWIDLPACERCGSYERCECEQDFCAHYWRYTVDLIQKARAVGLNRFNDCHYGNWMVSYTGHIAITDPYSCANTSMDQITNLLKQIGVLPDAN